MLPDYKMKPQRKSNSAARKVKTTNESKVASAMVAALAKGFGIPPQLVRECLSTPEDQFPSIQDLVSSGANTANILLKTACS
jgi:hypothetical protein